MVYKFTGTYFIGKKSVYGQMEFKIVGNMVLDQGNKKYFTINDSLVL